MRQDWHRTLSMDQAALKSIESDPIDSSSLTLLIAIDSSITLLRSPTAFGRMLVPLNL